MNAKKSISTKADNTDEAYHGDDDVHLGDIGARLRAFRLGRGLTPDSMAESLGISRAALYRVEKGHISKINTLTKISVVLGVSLPNLLGVGVEYIDNAVAFFERLRQIEERSTHITGLFGPISYLLSSGDYDKMLQEVLLDTVPSDPEERAEAAHSMTVLFDILKQRKSQYQRKRPVLVALIASSDIERFLLHGALGRYDLSEKVIERRRQYSRSEVIHIEALLRSPPPGVQIGIVVGAATAMTFQIVRQSERSVVTISPFRLGEQPNLGLGLGMITSASEPLTLHEGIAKRLWDRALRHEAAADYVRMLIDRYAVPGR